MIIQEFGDDLNWKSVTAWPGHNGFLVWDKIISTTYRQYITIRHTFLRHSDKMFNLADVIAISHSKQRFKVDPYSDYGLTIRSVVTLFPLVGLSNNYNYDYFSTFS